MTNHEKTLNNLMQVTDKEMGGVEIMKNLTVRKKIQLLIATAIIAMILLASAGLYFLNQMSNASQAMYQENLIPVQEVAQIRIDTRALDSFLVEMMLTTDPKRIEELGGANRSRQAQIRSSLNKYERTSKYDGTIRKTSGEH